MCANEYHIQRLFQKPSCLYFGPQSNTVLRLQTFVSDGRVGANHSYSTGSSCFFKYLLNRNMAGELGLGGLGGDRSL